MLNLWKKDFKYCAFFGVRTHRNITSVCPGLFPHDEQTKPYAACVTVVGTANHGFE